MTSTRLLAALALVFGFAPSAAAGQRADNPHGPQIGACVTCHSATAWKPVEVRKDFRHAEQTFPLDGAHARTACTACHKSLVFTGTPSTCASCHSDVHKGEFGTACARCHNSRSFTDEAPMRRAHELSRFPLRGAHATASCASCHAPSEPGQPQFANRPTACAGCHESTFRATKAPDHVAAQFPRDCARCHGVVTWNDAKFDHSTARFPLTGAHRAVSCDGCHGDKAYTGKSMECVACHRSAFDQSANPPHRNGFPTACASCHSTATWHDAKFDHASTAFALTGAHVKALCSACHGDGVYKGKSASCISCHQASFAAATLPPHSSLGFSTACAACHTTVAWAGGTYDHGTTRFPLTGAHRTVLCAECHGDRVYRGKSMACASCHLPKYNATTNPNHAASGFPTACESCHTTSQWIGAVFNHAATAFPLTGAHASALCSACHADGVYKGKPTACISCHQTDLNGAALPPHSTLGFSTVCSTCHTTATWAGGTFDHAITRFPLTGSHRAATCRDCHGDGVYRGKTMVCSGCHMPTYTATTNPPHAAAGFPTTCEACHTATQWTGAVFSHSGTRFPLTGAHVTAPCSSCHGDGVYRGKTMVCSGCHLAKYQATTNPNHAAAAFPTTCESCHTTTRWTGATFNHDATYFPIYSGKHQGRWSVCADCHTSPTNFRIFTCLTCHLKPQMDAKHAGRSGYRYDSPTCYSCHPRGSA